MSYARREVPTVRSDIFDRRCRFAEIQKQVRDSEFKRDLNERLKLAEQDKQNAVELAETKAASELQKAA